MTQELMEDLSVRIPKKFKRALSERFNPKKAEKNEEEKTYYILKACPLCKEFLDFNCKGCPFKSDFQHGCYYWLKKVIGKELCFRISLYGITWDEDRDKETREQLETLRKKAKELIIWEGVKK